MRRLMVAGSLMVVTAVAGGAAQTGAALAGRVVLTDGRLLAVPSAGEDRARRLALVAGRWANTAVAVEVLPVTPATVARAVWAPGPPEEGRTVGALLEGYVGQDPRYSWREVGGVAVVRPVEAWAEAGHLLHRRLGRVDLRDVTAREALVALFGLVGEVGGQGGGAVPAAREAERDGALTAAATAHRVSLVRTDATLLDVLNALVVAHGALTWRLSWCGAPRDAAHAQLELMTFYGEWTAVAGKGCRP